MWNKIAGWLDDHYIVHIVIAILLLFVAYLILGWVYQNLLLPLWGACVGLVAGVMAGSPVSVAVATVLAVVVLFIIVWIIVRAIRNR